MKPVKIYTTDYCGYCQRAKQLLSRKGVPYEPGDSLLLVSDGAVEAHDSGSELFGFERLEETIAQARPGDVRELVELVLERVQEHMGDAEQHDDITIVAVRPAITPDIALLDEEQAITYATL